MATELRENLNAILTEKNEKILPENIRKGVTVFGVEGALDAGDFIGTTTYDNCLSMSEDVLDIPGWVKNKIYNAPEILATTADKYNNQAQVQNKCKVDGSNAWSYRAFLKYNIDEILNKKDVITLKSAKLYFTVAYGNDYYKESTSYLGQVYDAWTETSTNWDNKPEISEYQANNPLTPTWSMANVEVGDVLTIDITEIFKHWLNNEPNHGICMRAITEGEYRHDWHLYNRRYNNGASATYIEIVYDEYEM